MNTIAAPEERSKKRKNRSQIDKKETEAFLSRPAKKVENLNQSLKKSYQKNFFNKPSFEHFKILKEKRRDKNNDSIASEENEDSQFMLSHSRSSLRESSRNLNYTQRRETQILGHANKKMKGKQGNPKDDCNDDLDSQRSSSNSSSTPNGSCSDSSDSQISSQGTSSVKSQEFSHKQQAHTAKQEEKFRVQVVQQQNESMMQANIGNKTKQQDKRLVSESQSSFANNVQLKTQVKPFQRLKITPAYLSRGKRTRLSPHIQKVLDAKNNNLLQLFQSTEEKAQAKIQQEKISIKQQKMKTAQQKPVEIPKKSETKKQLQAVTIKPSTCNNNLSLNSKVIVESVLICTSYAKPQTNEQYLSWFCRHFQHAPCCSFRKKVIVEKEQCDQENPLKREDNSDEARKRSGQQS